jgi:hypothetical protein
VYNPVGLLQDFPVFDRLSPCESKTTKVNAKEWKRRVQRKNMSLIGARNIGGNLAHMEAWRCCFI